MTLPGHGEGGRSYLGWDEILPATIHLRGRNTSEGMTLSLIWRELIRDESGQDLIEYALVAALIGLGAVVSMKGLATKISSAFTAIGTNLTSDV